MPKKTAVKKPTVKVNDMRAKKNPAGGAVGIKVDGASSLKVGTSALTDIPKLKSMELSGRSLKNK